MATITLSSIPELTPERAQQVFEQHFSDRYEVYRAKIRNRDFIVKKSGWTGVGVRVKQEKKGTTFVFTALIPNALLQALFGGFIAYLMLHESWKALEAEVASFIQTTPEFQPTGEQRAAA